MINQQILLLVALQDLDQMITEASDRKLSRKEEAMGFELAGKDQLLAAREELVSKIDEEYVSLYEKLTRRYNHAIALVRDDFCLGCFIRVPSAKWSGGRSGNAVVTCEKCGRILYWME
jgi:predicted  nucleic acid-binding Zn-ribbon protein